MSKLYEIASEYAKLLDSDLEPEMIADTVEGMEGELVDKIEQLLSICKTKQGTLGASGRRRNHSQTGLVLSKTKSKASTPTSPHR